MYKILKVTIWDKKGKNLILDFIPKIGENDYICEDLRVFRANLLLTRPDLQVDLFYVTTKPIKTT